MRMTSTRPTIPAELRRTVLLEAGHRCAVPTCQHPQVDLHHIIPWSEVREHRFDNLVALCPNCHRRAGRGQIDRKALLRYKLRLGAQFGPTLRTEVIPEVPGLPVWILSQTEAHETVFRRIESSESPYTVEVEFPVFADSGREALNAAVRGIVAANEQEIVALAEAPDRYIPIPFSLVGSYAVTLDCQAVVSLRLAFSAYTGGAHGSKWVETLTYRPETATQLRLCDVFEDLEAGVSRLSDLAISGLLELGRDESIARRGAGPDAKNFQDFNLTPDGLGLYFKEYQTGCYAEGPAEIVIAYRSVYSHLSAFMRDVITVHGGTGS